MIWKQWYITDVSRGEGLLTSLLMRLNLPKSILPPFNGVVSLRMVEQLGWYASIDSCRYCTLEVLLWTFGCQNSVLLLSLKSISLPWVTRVKHQIVPSPGHSNYAHNLYTNQSMVINNIKVTETPVTCLFHYVEVHNIPEMLADQ